MEKNLNKKKKEKKHAGFFSHFKLWGKPAGIIVFALPASNDVK